MSDQKKEKKNFDGVQSAAEMLAHLDHSHREKLLKDLEKKDPAVAERVKKKMFTFENLDRIEPPGLQVLLREVPSDQWVLALRNASEPLKNLIWSQVSQKMGQILKEELLQQGPQKLSRITQAQQEIVRFAQMLQLKGRIKIR